MYRDAGPSPVVRARRARCRLWTPGAPSLNLRNRLLLPLGPVPVLGLHLNVADRVVADGWARAGPTVGTSQQIHPHSVGFIVSRLFIREFGHAGGAVSEREVSVFGKGDRFRHPSPGRTPRRIVVEFGYRVAAATSARSSPSYVKDCASNNGVPCASRQLSWNATSVSDGGRTFTVTVYGSSGSPGRAMLRA